MKKEFTKEFILSERGCYSREQVNALSFINNEIITLKDMLTSELPLKDKFWWLCKKCELTKDENVLIAIKCARVVLHLFEDKYPNDDRPRKAILAAEKYLETHNAAAAAYAADAAYAAAAANAYAADAAYAAAAAAAADAADAAAAAAADAAYAADAANAYAADAANAYAAAADAAAEKDTLNLALEQILTKYY